LTDRSEEKITSKMLRMIVRDSGENFSRKGEEKLGKRKKNGRGLIDRDRRGETDVDPTEPRSRHLDH